MISDNEIEQTRIRLLNATKGPGRYLLKVVILNVVVILFKLKMMI